MHVRLLPWDRSLTHRDCLLETLLADRLSYILLCLREEAPIEDMTN